LPLVHRQARQRLASGRRSASDLRPSLMRQACQQPASGRRSASIIGPKSSAKPVIRQACQRPVRAAPMAVEGRAPRIVRPPRPTPVSGPPGEAREATPTAVKRPPVHSLSSGPQPHPRPPHASVKPASGFAEAGKRRPDRSPSAERRARQRRHGAARTSIVVARVPSPSFRTLMSARCPQPASRSGCRAPHQSASCRARFDDARRRDRRARSEQKL
jgi:hypothetical protein